VLYFVVMKLEQVAMKFERQLRQPLEAGKSVADSAASLVRSVLRETSEQRRRKELIRLYTQTLGRSPDREGFGMYSTELSQGRPLGEIRTDILLSPEFRGRVQKFADKKGRERAIQALYQKVLGRKIDLDGKQTYIDGGSTPDQTLEALVTSEEYRNKFFQP
jgi:hypothetical protein